MFKPQIVKGLSLEGNICLLLWFYSTHELVFVVARKKYLIYTKTSSRLKKFLYYYFLYLFPFNHSKFEKTLEDQFPKTHRDILKQKTKNQTLKTYIQ